MTFPKTHAAVAAGLLVIISSGPVDAASPVPTQWIVTTARATGARGEEYLSSLRLLNFNSLEASVALTFLPQSPLDPSLSANGDNSTASSVSVLVPAGEKLDIGNVLSFLGVNSGAGAIRVASSGRDPQGQPLPVAAHSLTTTVVGSPAQALFEPPFRHKVPAELVGAGETAWLPFLWTGGSLEGSWYRSNVFLLSTNADSETVVTLTLVDYAHNVRGKQGHHAGSPCPDPDQRCRILLRLSDLLLRVSVGHPPARGDPPLPFGQEQGPVAAGGSIIDNLTGASLYVSVVKASALQAR